MLGRLLSALGAASRRAKRYADRYWRWRWHRESAAHFGVGGALKDPATKPHRDAIGAYWAKHFGRPVSPVWHLACEKVSGHRDVRYVPTPEWFEEILPFLNEMPLRAAFRDKNLSDIFLDYPRSPKTRLKRIHGHYYDGANAPLSAAAAEQQLASSRVELIVKPSQTDEGFGIRTLAADGGNLYVDGTLCDFARLEAAYGNNFLIQERITQHPGFARVHPSSVNTIRMVTLRWRRQIRVLMAFARFGTQGRLVDNAAAGGICVGIDDNGRFNDKAIDINGNVYEHHPTTGYAFADRLSVPRYDRVCDLVTKLHGQIYHFDFVSWDIAIDRAGEPMFLEVNFRGVAHLYQFARGGPLFGDLTDEILEAVRDRRMT